MKLFIAIIATALTILPGSMAGSICGTCYEKGTKRIDWLCTGSNIRSSCDAQCSTIQAKLGWTVCCNVPDCP
ncbi:hypothetical protein Ptr902_13287 [Pyrenophora tritici-repentis]|nr:hypothetical protein Ptr902_13287 [Pyrenophora tritici-repentis]